MTNPAQPSWKPVGYPSASPYLIVTDARKALAFLGDVFGAEPLRVIPSADGDGIMHAEARLDDSVIMMGEARDGGTANVHVYVADADAVFARALAAGGSSIQDMTRSGDGDYRGGVADGNGTIWWIAQQEDAQG